MALEVQNQQPLEQDHVSGGGGGGGGVTNGIVLRQAIPITLDLFHTTNPSSHIQLQDPSPLSLSRQNFLNLKRVKRRYLEDTKMSRQNGPKLDLKLNLSPPRANPQVESPPRRSATASPPSSCVSSELNQDESTLRYSSSPEATSMMLVGCPRCLMYVMLAEEDPRCPKCKSTVLLDVVRQTTTTTTTTTRS